MPAPERREFGVPFEGLRLHAEHWSGAPGPPEALILHGGGTSTCKGLTPLREYLLARGIGSLALDFVGHGRTGGALIGSSLASRLAQVEAVLHAHPLPARRSAVIGFSMGGHIAALTAARLGFSGCGLVIPAAYAAEAAKLAFGPAFQTTLRRASSWQDSDAFAAIAGYRGHLQIISAEHDAVVPAAIPARYEREALEAASVHHHVVQGSAHDLSIHFEEKPAARDIAYGLLAQMISRTIAFEARLQTL